MKKLIYVTAILLAIGANQSWPHFAITTAAHAQATGEIDPEPEQESKRRCIGRAFEVNDFGKEGPISLAKQDMRNYADKLRKRKDVSDLRVSHKKPTCRLFLWLGPFSEYTCRIEATMCWNVKQ